MIRRFALFYMLIAWCAGVATPGGGVEKNWDPPLAAKYLDARAAWWESWPKAQRDHETVCVSCHTVLPYALSRTALRTDLGEDALPNSQRQILEYVRKRVGLWNEVEPYYNDAKSGPGKSVESRATESVLNALILSSEERGQHQLSATTRAAFDAAWALQLTSGPSAGAWNWQVFHLAPWESAESQYQGATFMALAVGFAPSSYQKEGEVGDHVRSLMSYLHAQFATQPLLNKVVVLWASARLPGLISKGERDELVSSLLEQQRPDGGWSLSTLETCERSDHTPQETSSDGYATAMAVLALREAKIHQYREQLDAGVRWLVQNQNRESGAWSTSSLNKKRDPATDVGKFMSDAATGYAVLALESGR